MARSNGGLNSVLSDETVVVVLSVVESEVVDGSEPVEESLSVVELALVDRVETGSSVSASSRWEMQDRMNVPIRRAAVLLRRD